MKTLPKTTDAQPGCLSRFVRRPGSGWKWLGCSVWEHTSGARIHCLGRVRMADGNSRMWTWEEEYRFKRITGGNTKRALMLLARTLLPPNIQRSETGEARSL